MTWKHFHLQNLYFWTSNNLSWLLFFYRLVVKYLLSEFNCFYDLKVYKKKFPPCFLKVARDVLLHSQNHRVIQAKRGHKIQDKVQIRIAKRYYILHWWKQIVGPSLVCSCHVVFTHAWFHWLQFCFSWVIFVLENSCSQVYQTLWCINVSEDHCLWFV